MQESCFLKSQTSLYHANGLKGLHADALTPRLLGGGIGREKIWGGGEVMLRIELGPHATRQYFTTKLHLLTRDKAV